MAKIVQRMSIMMVYVQTYKERSCAHSSRKLLWFRIISKKLGGPSFISLYMLHSTHISIPDICISFSSDSYLDMSLKEPLLNCAIAHGTLALLYLFIEVIILVLTALGSSSFRVVPVVENSSLTFSDLSQPQLLL
jgi:hypothetical protein